MPKKAKHFPIIILNKTAENEFINAGELLTALKDSRFVDDSPIMIHTVKDQDYLAIVANCGSCQDLHLVGGSEKLDCPPFSGNSEIFINKLSCDDVSHVKRRDLLPILEKMDKNMVVSANTQKDPDYFMRICSVVRCHSKKCTAIHISVGYIDETLIPNPN